ncbi:MAG: hypothetical protein AAFP07_03510 [Cyanobacteria bacterium J06606_4]
MDRERIAGFTAELKGQLKLIKRVDARLASRVGDGLDTPGQLDSVAYQIHNLYCAVEDLLKMVASAFENNIGTASDWHRLLLLRLSQPVNGIRPAFLSEASLDTMNKLRGFRHLVRHAYGTDIELEQLRPNLQAAQTLYRTIAEDTDTFISQLVPFDELEGRA